MTRTYEFLVAKDPETERTGDMAVFRLVLSLAREAYSVRYACLSAADGTRDGNRLIRKPSARPLGIVAKAVTRRRSLVHSRFDVGAMRDWVARSDADAFIADHTYMAEPYLSAGRTEPLFVNTVVSESHVWESSYGRLGRLQAPRISADELRIARLATSLATYDAVEAESYRERGIEEAHWLDLTMPPVETHGHTASATRLVFLGDRDWKPNGDAYERALALWPRIRAGIPGAELVAVGRSSRSFPEVDGVRDLGFVDDLDGLLNESRGILAPVATGGGVRVKILDAASRGIPVIGTATAIGSLDRLFPLTPHDDPDGVVEEARRLLLDRDASLAEGAALYEANRAHWAARGPHASISRWLGAA